jgi:hypothetical protein
MVRPSSLRSVFSFNSSVFFSLLANLNPGQYKFYAVQIPSLQDVPGFPVIIDGNFANNDNTR